MSLPAGTRIGPYEVLAPLGKGGMGEVYRARDTRLHRDVALKILPDIFVGDPDRLARFEREAYVLASLSHPNIAHIHGLEDSGGRKALVLELVEGPTLSDRIAEGPIGLDEAIAIARQIGDALGAAHDVGIVHRDLKPANVKIRPDGTVKVLDFGLAKPLGADAGAHPTGDTPNAPTVTSPAMTQQGMILGTAAYMSPEQARGKPVDRHTDIWAFGVVLFEMLTGRLPFAGDDVSETLAAILKTDPDLAAVPSRGRRLVRRCLEKDARKRLHDVRDAWELLDESPSGLETRRRVSMAWMAAGVAFVGVAAYVAGAQNARPAPSAARETRRFQVAVTASAELPLAGPQVALSPDGSTLVYRAQTKDGIVRLYKRSLSTLEATPLSGTEGARYQGPPFFSPDGQWIAFVVDSRLMKLNLSGGEPVLVADLPSGEKNSRTGWNWGGGWWGTDGMMTLALFEVGLVRVPADGGMPESILETDGIEQWFMRPQMLTGNKVVLFTATNGGFGAAEVRTFDLERHQMKTIVAGGLGRVLPSGHLAFVREGTIWAVPFNTDRLEILGDPKPVERGVRTGGLGTAWLGVADDGTLVYVGGEAVPPPRDTLVWVDRQGLETPIAGVPPHFILEVSLSPKNDHLAATVGDEGRQSLFVGDLRSLTRLTRAGELSQFPVWSPDGQRILYSLRRNRRQDVFAQPWDSPGDGQRLTDVPSGALPTAVSSDGTRLVVQSEAQPSVVSVYTLSGSPSGPATLESSFDGALADVSRDGRWIAYQSAVSGKAEVWVRSFPDVKGRGKQISMTGGQRPRWSRSTDELFYTIPGADGAMAVVSIGPKTTLSDPWPSRKLFSTAPYAFRVWRSYDVSADAKRFLMTKPLPSARPDRPLELVVVQNWFSDVARIVPTTK